MYKAFEFQQVRDTFVHNLIEYVLLHSQPTTHTQLIHGYNQDLIDKYNHNQIIKIFNQNQLNSLQTYISTLPQNKCSLILFIVFGLKTLKYPIEDVLFVINGLRSLFSKIVSKKKQKLITYQKMLKINLNSQPMPPDFQPKIQQIHTLLQYKKQDNSFHQTPIKQIIFSKHLKLLFVLNQGAQLIKVYDLNFKIVSRIIPNKDKHDKKSITSIGWCHVYNKMAILMEDNSFTALNAKLYIQNFYNFHLNQLNEIVIPYNKPLMKVIFIETWNSWACVTEQFNLIKVDLQKKSMNLVKIPKQISKVQNIFEIAKKNYLVLLFQNQLFIYDQKLEVPFFTFAHGNQIQIFRYGQDTGRFYISGREKLITSFIYSKKNNFEIKTYEVSRHKICDFLVYEEMGLLVVLDQSGVMKILDLSNQRQNSIQTIKNINKETARLSKIQKEIFCVYEQQMQIYNLAKETIETDYQMVILPKIIVSSQMECMIISFNNKIFFLGMSNGLPFQTYEQQNSDITQVKNFVLDSGNKKVIVLQSSNFIKEVIYKQRYNQTFLKCNTKKLNTNIIGMVYIQPKRYLMCWSQTNIYILHYQGENSFNILKNCTFSTRSKIKQCYYDNDYQIITVQLTSGVIISLLANQMKIIQSFQLVKQDQVILNQITNLFELGLTIMLTDQNQLIFLQSNRKVTFVPKQRMNLSKQYQWTRAKWIECSKVLKINEVQEKQILTDNQNASCEVSNLKFYVLFDREGRILLMNFTSYFQTLKQNNTKQNNKFRNASSDPLYHRKSTSIISDNMINPYVISGFQNKKISIDDLVGGEWRVIKFHELEVFDIEIIFLQDILFITIAADRFIKIFKENQEKIMEIKLPTFTITLNNFDTLTQEKKQRGLKRTKNLILQMYNRQPKKFTHPKKQLKDLINKSVIDPFISEDFFNVESQEIDLIIKHNIDLSQIKQKLTFTQSYQDKKQFQMEKKKKMKEHFLQLCREVDMKNKNKQVPYQINVERNKLLLSREDHLNEKQKKKELIRIRKLNNERQMFVKDFINRIGIFERSTQIIPKSASQQKNIYQIEQTNKPLFLKRKYKFVKKRKNELDLMQKEFAEKNRRVNSKISNKNKKKKKMPQENNSFLQKYSQKKYSELKQQDVGQMIQRIRNKFQRDIYNIGFKINNLRLNSLQNI